MPLPHQNMNTPNPQNPDLLFELLSEETLHLATCAWIRFHHSPSSENRRKVLRTLLQLYIMDRYADDFPQISEGLEYAIRIDVILYVCGPDFGLLLKDERLVRATVNRDFNATQNELKRIVGEAWKECAGFYGDDANDDTNDVADILLLNASAEMRQSMQVVAIRQSLYRGELSQQAANIYQRLLYSPEQTYTSLGEEFEIPPEQIREEIQLTSRVIRDFAAKSGFIL